MKRLAVRAACEDDLAAGLPLLDWEINRNPWIVRVPEMLRFAVQNPEGEHRACVAHRDGELVGLGAYGIIAGTVRTGMIYAILVAPRSRRAGIGSRILFHVADELAAANARMIFAEVPGDPYVVRYRAMLISYGFMEESRIDDFYRDGVPQIVSHVDLP
ncbi:MAG: GNAT family N-acetyltransferase [Gemmatimonadaceae bacterium]|nr:GNAT family N-acetyltransferase [Gemmatimonadaceae bacterium]MDQ3244565.1 GNAT family N-acetyltransferase [Gemmatimonadota bacterium]